VGQRGGSGLLVEEELARAVCNESAVAIKYWWGASDTAVNHWRQVLRGSRCAGRVAGALLLDPWASRLNLYP
jgi:hypothetical protein